MKRWKHNFKKGMALVLSLAMVAGLVPAMSGGANTVQAADSTVGNAGKEPSVSAYATKEQMMGDTFAPNSDGVATNYGKLVFGHNSDGNAQEWYILGKDTGVSGDNTIIFAASPIATGKAFNSNIANNTNTSSWSDCNYGEASVSEVYANHYGASDLRDTLQSMATNTNYFTTAEQDLMNPTTVTTNDAKNSKTYTTKDKLYALAADDSGSSYKTIKAGSGNNTVLAMSSYWSSGDRFWLRMPFGINENKYSLLAVPGRCVLDSPVFYGGAVQSASNLNLSSVLFASAAKAASSGTVEAKTIASEAAMTLRLDGTGKNIGTVTYNTTTGDIKTVKGSTSQTVALVVQGNDGINNWYYSKKIDTSETINASDIKSALGLTSDMDLSACKIWLEITDIDGLIYAVNATEIVSITSAAITDIETPVSNTALDTEASCTTEGVSSTTPQITWTPSDITAGYNKSYTASITLTADTGYEFTDSTTATINGNSATSVTKNADGTLTVTYAFPATANPVPTPVSYKILDGANSDWKQNTEETITIRGNGDFSKFVGVKIDGNTIDAKNYTAKEGSTIITLTTDYLKTLSIGTHTFEIVWTDGSAGTNFTVSKNDSGSETSKDDGSKGNNDNPNNNSNNNPATVTTDKNQDISGSQSGNNQQITAPKTGDNNHLVMWVTLLGVSLAGLLSLLYMRNKKDNE